MSPVLTVGLCEVLPTGRSTAVVPLNTKFPVIVAVRSVPSDSIFSPPLPNATPTLFGICTSDVAVKLIFAPEVIVRSVPSLPIFSAPSSAKWISVLASVTMCPVPAGLSSKFALESVVIELSCKLRLSICTDVSPVSAVSNAYVIAVPLTDDVMLAPPANLTEF